MEEKKDEREVTFNDAVIHAPLEDSPVWTGDNTTPGQGNTQERSTKRAIMTLIVVVFINLLNYMDRFTVSGVLTLIKKYFDIDNKIAGLLQTVFICSYMAFAPIFGFLGDRYSRKYVMAVGVLIWSVMTYVGSLMDRDQFWYFFLIRGLVGIGEASYSTVAPTIIADLFVGDARTKALSVFYFAIPCGSGLGFIVGSKVAAAAHEEWQWALRVTPIFGFLCVLGCLFIVHEPKRGAAEVPSEKPDDLSASVVHPTTSYVADLKYILQVRGFLWATIGFTLISFVIGALAFWAPSFAYYSQLVNGLDVTEDDVSYVFGIVTFVAGIAGVAGGAEIARRYRHKNQSADALVCAFGAVSSAPFLFLALWLASKQVILTWILICIGEVLLCLNWVPNGDLLLYVIIPSRRSTAEAVQILIIHLFGDAISPFIVGAISDALAKGDKSYTAQQSSLLYALYLTPFFCVLGGAAYFVCAKFVPKDRERADQLTKGFVKTPSEETLNTLPAGGDEDVMDTEGIDVRGITSDENQLIPNVDVGPNHYSRGAIVT